MPKLDITKTLSFIEVGYIIGKNDNYFSHLNECTSAATTCSSDLSWLSLLLSEYFEDVLGDLMEVNPFSAVSSLPRGDNRCGDLSRSDLLGETLGSPSNPPELFSATFGITFLSDAEIGERLSFSPDIASILEM